MSKICQYDAPTSRFGVAADAMRLDFRFPSPTSVRWFSRVVIVMTLLGGVMSGGITFV